MFIQGILVVQPTHTAKQKKEGTYAHAALNDVALLTAIAGLVVIEYNKISHNGTHFVSPHAILGLITYILTALQAVVGITQYFIPQLYGGEANAKKLYKYHRVGGYVILLAMLATVALATQTDYNKNVLQIQLWAVLVAAHWRRTAHQAQQVRIPGWMLISNVHRYRNTPLMIVFHASGPLVMRLRRIMYGMAWHVWSSIVGCYIGGVGSGSFINDPLITSSLLMCKFTVYPY